MPWTTKERRDELRQNTPIPDIDKLPDTALLNDRQKSLHSGFSEYTLRRWRMDGRGPKIVYIEGKPRSFVRDYREWLARQTSGAVAA